jgi:hypothetical protein
VSGLKISWQAPGALLLAALVACAAPTQATTPSLRLSPASLGGTLALQQQLTATARGQTQRMDVLLEADAQSVRLAVLSLGQTAARLEWDGTTLAESHAAWWPAAVSGERVLADLQLVLWPAHAVSAALPRGWSLDVTPGLRVLRHLGQAVVQVEYDGPASAQLTHLREDYVVRVESRVVQGAP